MDHRRTWETLSLQNWEHVPRIYHDGVCINVYQTSIHYFNYVYVYRIPA